MDTTFQKVRKLQKNNILMQILAMVLCKKNVIVKKKEPSRLEIFILQQSKFMQ